MTLLITVRDVETGDESHVTIPEGEYFLVCHDPCYRAGVQTYANGTHVITVKGRKEGGR